jgi:molybdopterin-guanine dinucleotide biosynthesis protein A
MSAQLHDQVREKGSALAGIILAGGQSSRMGQSKVWLPWGEQTLLQHIASTLRPQVDPLIVVGGQGQELPALPPGAILAYDAEADQGPLVGLLAGLLLAPDRSVFVTGCDYPFIVGEVVTQLAAELKDFDAVVPRWQGQAHPLVAVYRAGIRPMVEATRANGKRSLHALLGLLHVRWVEDEEWRELDPSGRMLWNVNTPEEYQAALTAFTSS